MIENIYASGFFSFYYILFHVNLDFLYLVLKYVIANWNNSPWVDMLSHQDTLSRFQANQSLLLLFNTACLTEKQQIHLIKGHFKYYIWTKFENKICLKEHLPVHVVVILRKCVIYINCPNIVSLCEFNPSKRSINRT
jgi:hypothetical protein